MSVPASRGGGTGPALHGCFWAEPTASLEQSRPHLRCDDILGKLKSAGLPGEFVKWCDPLCQGATRSRLTQAEWRRTRVEFVAQDCDLPLEEVQRDLAEEDRVGACLAQDEVVLWFEHDLFDQSILIYLLDWFARHRGDYRLSLVSISSHPEVERFIGLGNLDAPLEAAILRHLQELPWTGDGLALTERLALEAIQGESAAGWTSFARCSTARRRPGWETPCFGGCCSVSVKQSMLLLS